jgi:hypothetical protein
LEELRKELGEKLQVKEPEYLGCVEFTIADGRQAVLHKFLTCILSGQPKIQKPEFFSRLKYIPFKDLEKYPLSPGLGLLLPKLKEKFGSDEEENWY